MSEPRRPHGDVQRVSASAATSLGTVAGRHRLDRPCPGRIDLRQGAGELVADPDRLAVRRRPRPRSARRRPVIVALDRVRRRIDPGDGAVERVRDPDRRRADRDRARARCPTLIGWVTILARGSMRLRLPSDSLVTQTAPSPTAIASAPAATGIGRRGLPVARVDLASRCGRSSSRPTRHPSP